MSRSDSLLCSFYSRTGACMHGDACSRMHIKPKFSRTLLLPNFYPNPNRFNEFLEDNSKIVIEEKTLQNNFNEFYIDLYEELRTFGPLSDLLVSGNLCDHLSGNVLVTYDKLEDAVYAYTNLFGRFYAGRPIEVQFSPVQNIKGSICKEYPNCGHKGTCNFIHPQYPSPEVLEMCVTTGLTERKIERGHLRNDCDSRFSRNIDKDSYNRREDRDQRGRDDKYKREDRFRRDDRDRSNRGDNYSERRSYDDRHTRNGRDSYQDRNFRRDSRRNEYFYDRNSEYETRREDQYPKPDDKYTRYSGHESRYNPSQRQYQEHPQIYAYDESGKYPEPEPESSVYPEPDDQRYYFDSDTYTQRRNQRYPPPDGRHDMY